MQATTEYVIRGPGVEARLAPGGRVRVGRHATNDLVVEDPTVSRFHARIRWPVGARRPVVEDLGSANGTVLGGAEVHGAMPLDEQATLAVGDVLLRVELEAPAVLADATPLVCRLYTELSTEGLEGPLDDQRTVADLLLDLERKRCTGTLRLRGEDVAGTLTLAGGRIVDATLSVHTGLPALRAALTRVRRGWFSFHADVEPHECSLNVGARDLLAGEARPTDRVGRSRPAHVAAARRGA